MKDPYGELFEAHVQKRYPELKYIGNGYGKPDFDAGIFQLEVKCSNKFTGSHIPYTQFKSKKHISPIYLIGFHNASVANLTGDDVFFFSMVYT